MSLRTLAQRLGLRVDNPWCKQPLQRLQQYARCYSTVEQHQDEIDAINEKFVEARDEIEYATEDAETVYFNESADTARKAVQDVLEAFQQLCGKLSESERGKLQRSMGLKMEQLKAELDQLDRLHDD